MSLEILLFIAFSIKHFICDFPLQAFPYMYRNKGTYGHLGGFLHAGVHVIGTFIVLAWLVNVEFAIFFSMVDGFIHYHIDWAKMNLGARFNLKPDNSEWFWILMGLDQLLHMLTYAFIIYWVV